MAGTAERVSIKGRQKMGKKHIEINIVKNPQDQNPTFISDPLKELMLQYSKQQNNDNDSSETNNINQKLVKKARRDPGRFSKHDLRNKSKQVSSKQNHSPVYE
jgi:hypothetical protein